MFRALPIAIALVVVLFQYFSSEKFTNEAGRTAHHALNPQQEQALGLQSYQEVLRQSEAIDAGAQYEMVKQVANRLAGVAGSSAKDFDWRVALVESSQINAFCLPGGKIVVYTGILPVTRTEAGLATVLGHEMAHATLRHGSERLLQQKETQAFLTGVQFSLGDMTYDQRRAVMGAMGAGAQYGLLLPFSRLHESEADKMGLFYMARAGYDPQEAIDFWQRMSEATASGGAQPELLSTHPSDAARIAQLKQLLPAAEEEFRRSR
jgi:metalloendopeptidase OMA1, mitochondrial